MKKLFKKIMKNRSKLLGLLCVIESLLGIYFISYFNYLDRLSYEEGLNHASSGLTLVLENMWTSTWWALILLLFIIIAIFSLVAFIYKDEKFQFMNILLWFVLLLLSINIKDSLLNNLSLLLIYVPIIIANIYAYLNQKKLSK